MKKQILLSIGILGLSFVLVSWGSSGHYKINQASGLSFNEEMAQFSDWVSVLAAHASDADDRKSWDPTEGPKHYIDIDNYNEFITNGSIPMNWDSVISAHGSSFVYDNGILPWATLITYDSLVSCFERHDWDKAVLFASDLGHYVADGHMPMHITRNYNGQYSGNSGIHSRYESTMINAYISQFDYTGFEISEVEQVDQYVFDYLYSSYIYVDSILAADDYAKSVAGNTSSTLYRQTLWEQTQGFTIPLFSNASHALAELIYTAWIQAGSPAISPDGVNENRELMAQLNQNAPNPFSTSTTISYRLEEHAFVELSVYDLAGKLQTTIVKGQKEMGDHSIQWHPQQVQPGVYILTLQAGNSRTFKKIVLTN